MLYRAWAYEQLSGICLLWNSLTNFKVKWLPPNGTFIR